MIPNIIHIVWIGDENKKPHHCIQSWKKFNPLFAVKLWGNETLKDFPWRNRAHIEKFLEKEVCGAADIMRYEILYNEGGLTIDADAMCIRPIPEWLLNTSAFASWGNEIARPGLISNAFLGSKPGNTLFQEITNDIAEEITVTHDAAWRTVGPLRLTNKIRNQKNLDLTIWPSHFFSPTHYTGISYTGDGAIFANQQWHSTQEQAFQMGRISNRPRA